LKLNDDTYQIYEPLETGQFFSIHIVGKHQDYSTLGTDEYPSQIVCTINFKYHVDIKPSQ